MRKFVMAMIAAVFAAFTFSALAADPVKTDPNPGSKPGRQIDDTVKTDPAKSAQKPGRQADEQAQPPAEGKKKSGKKKSSKKKPEESTSK